MTVDENVSGGFNNVAVISNIGKPDIAEMVERVAVAITGHDASCFLFASDAEALGSTLPIVEQSGGAAAMQVAVVLGGDGTMLHAVDLLWGEDIPLVGINIGKVGFLTAAEVHQTERVFDEIFAGRYWISKRVPVSCSLGGAEGHGFRALNEIVVGKLARDRLVHLDTFINGEFFTRYSGDGLIFSSATGSTAYSLSAGGPVVTPGLRCFLLTPICAHMLFSRPMVLDASDRVTVKIESGPEMLALSVDGQREEEIPPGASLDFFLEDHVVRIIELQGSSFYRTLREKFMSPPSCEEAG